MNKNINKIKLNDAENFGILFRVQKDYNIYHLTCVRIEKGKLKTAVCVSNISHKGYAEKLLPMFEEYWDKNNKILQFTDVPKSKNESIYNEVHERYELSDYFEQYQKEKKSNLEMAKIVKLERKLKKLNKEIKVVQEKIEELKE